MIDISWEIKGNAKKELEGIFEPGVIYIIGAEDFQKRAIEVLNRQNWNNEDEKLACIEILENLTTHD